MKTEPKASLHRPSLFGAISALAAIPALAIALQACTVPDPFAAEYLDNGRNWISGFGFGSRQTETQAGWAFGYAGDTGDTFEYMRLEDLETPVGSGAPAGLSADASVYRLSIENLFPDPGLESVPPGPPPAYWAMEAGEGNPPTAAIVDASANAIHGRTLFFSRDEKTEQRVRLTLSPNLLNAANPVAGSIYQINFLCRSSSNILHYSLDGSNSQSAEIAPNQINDVRILSQGYLDPGTEVYSLYFGPNSTQTASLDDFRVVRRGIDLALVLKLRLSDVTPTFISGRYAFSVWVKNDPEARYLLDAAATAPYQSRAVSLSIRASGNSEGGMRTVATSDATGWAEWTRISAEIPSGSVLSIDQNDVEPVLALRISPTDLSSATGLDAASILIAQPEFHFFLKSE